MEIPYKYIVLVLVILAILCIMMTVEYFSSKDDNKIISKKTINLKEDMTDDDVNNIFVSADNILRNMNKDKEKKCLISAPNLPTIKYMNKETMETVYEKIISNLEIDDEGELVGKDIDLGQTIGEVLESLIDEDFSLIFESVMANNADLTTEQKMRVYDLAKRNLIDLIRNDRKEYSCLLKFSNYDGETCTYNESSLVVPSRQDLLDIFVPKWKSLSEEVKSTLSKDATEEVMMKNDRGELVKVKVLNLDSTLQTETVQNIKNMLQFKNAESRKALTSATTSSGMTYDFALTSKIIDEVDSLDPLEFKNAVEQLRNDLLNYDNTEISLPGKLKLRVRNNRNYVASSIANILNSRSMRKESGSWLWKKTISNSIISQKTNIEPNIVYNMKLSKVARILNVDESLTFNQSIPSTYKLLRPRAILSNIENMSPSAQNYIYKALFDINNKEYDSLEETLSLPLTVNTPYEVIVNTQNIDKYAVEKVDTLLALLNNLYKIRPGNFVRQNNTLDGNGELKFRTDAYGLPLFVYDYKPVKSGKSSILRKVGRGVKYSKVTNTGENGEVSYSYERNENGTFVNEGYYGRSELSPEQLVGGYEIEAVFITNADYVFTGPGTTGLVLEDITVGEGSDAKRYSSGDFVYEGNDQSLKLINLDKCSFFTCYYSAVENDMGKSYKNSDNVNLTPTVGELSNWVVEGLRKKFQKLDQSTDSLKRLDLSMINYFINLILEENLTDLEKEELSNFRIDDNHLFPIRYRDPYPLVNIGKMKEEYRGLNRRTYVYPPEGKILNEIVPIRKENVIENFNFKKAAKRIYNKNRSFINSLYKNLVEGYGEVILTPGNNASQIPFTNLKPTITIKGNDTIVLNGEHYLDVQDVNGMSVLSHSGPEKSERIKIDKREGETVVTIDLVGLVGIQKGGTYSLSLEGLRIGNQDGVDIIIGDWQFTLASETPTDEELDEMVSWPQNIREVLTTLRVHSLTSKRDENGNIIFKKDESGNDVEVTVPIYKRDTQNNFPAGDLDSGFIYPGLSVNDTNVLDPITPILKPPQDNTGIGQSIILNHNGNFLVQVTNSFEENENGELVIKGESKMEQDAYRTYLDVTGKLGYNNIQRINLNNEYLENHPIKFVNDQLKYLFNWYGERKNDKKDNGVNEYTDIEIKMIEANQRDLLLINKLIITSGKEIEKNKRNIMNFKPRNTVNLVLETAKRTAADELNMSFDNDTLLRKIANTFSNYNICVSGGNPEISLDQLKGMNRLNFANLFEGRVTHIEQLNLFHNSAVYFSVDENDEVILGNSKSGDEFEPLLDVDGNKITFLTMSDVKRFYKAIFSNLGSYKDAEDGLSDILFSLIKLYETIRLESGDTIDEKINLFLDNKFSDLSNSSKLKIIYESINSLVDESSQDESVVRWKTDNNFDEITFYNDNFFNNGSMPVFRQLDDLKKFVELIYSKFTIEEYFKTRQSVTGMATYEKRQYNIIEEEVTDENGDKTVVNVDGEYIGSINVTESIENFVEYLRNETKKNLDVNSVYYRNANLMIDEYEKRTLHMPESKIDENINSRINIIVRTLNKNIRKRHNIMLENDSIKKAISVTKNDKLETVYGLLLGDLRKLSDRNEDLKLVSSSLTFAESLNPAPENFTQYDNRSNIENFSKTNSFFGLLNDDKYFDINNFNSSLLN